jgi:hypothetical protein
MVSTPRVSMKSGTSFELICRWFGNQFRCMILIYADFDSMSSMNVLAKSPKKDISSIVSIDHFLPQSFLGPFRGIAGRICENGDVRRLGKNSTQVTNNTITPGRAIKMPNAASRKFKNGPDDTSSQTVDALTDNHAA